MAHVIMSAYFWSGYPYDQVCEVEGEYVSCNQDMIRYWVFPPFPQFQPSDSKWMTSSQEILVSLYCYLTVAVVFGGTIAFLNQALLPVLKSIFQSAYEPDGEDQGINFRTVQHRQEVHGYIPQVRDNAFPRPLLACDISQLSLDLIGWKGEGGYAAHSLFEDAKSILQGRRLPPAAFSLVHYFPAKTAGN